MGIRTNLIRVVGLSLLCCWVGCSSPPKSSQNNNKIEPVLEIVPEPGVSDKHESPIPSGTVVQTDPGRPEDKPDDPDLFYAGTSKLWIGDACQKDSDCDFSGSYCMLPVDGFPDGYCMMGCSKHCPDQSGKTYTFCVKRGSGGACFIRCDTNRYPGTGCRPGYLCREEPRYNETSVKSSICVPDPSKAKPPTQPQPPPTQPSRWIGEPCSQDLDCDFADGFCYKENDGFPQGLCTAPCTRLCPDKAGKPETFCVAHGNNGICVSQCSTATGCRSEYVCQSRSRLGEPGIQKNVCVPSGMSQPNPQPPQPPQPPPSGSGDLTVTPGLNCYDQLTQWGVQYTKTSDPNTLLAGASRRCSISQPIKLKAPVLGVDYVIWTNQRVEMLVSCQLAQGIARFSHYLKQRGMNKVMHLGTYNCRKISGSSNLSNHSFGTAIDIAAVYGNDGTEYSLVKHWDHSSTWQKNGSMGCWSTQFNSVKAKVLYDVACDMWKQRFFSLILTPNYNRAHDDHFHADFSSTGRVLSLQPDGFIGTHQDHTHEEH